MPLSNKTLEVINKEKEVKKKFQILMNELSYRDNKNLLKISNIVDGICEIMDFEISDFYQGLFDNRWIKKLS